MAAKVRPGDPLKIAASDWNTLLGVAESARRGQLPSLQPPGYTTTAAGVIIPVKNSTGSDVSRFHAAAIDAPLYTHSDNADTFFNQLVLNGIAPTSSYFGRWAVFQEATPTSKIGRALIQGLTVAEITVGHADHDRVDIDTAGGAKLVSQFYGAGEILWKESATGTKWAIIRVGAFVSPKLKAVADEYIAAGSSGDVKVQLNGSDSQTVTAYLNWMHNDVGVDSGCELFIRFFKDENKYVITGAACA